MDDWRHRRITVLGLGRHGGGVGAVRWLAGRGARLTITDQADERALADSIAAVADVNVERWRLGGHDEGDFRSADAVVVNPAIRPGHPLVDFARSRGAAITSEIELFLNACPARVIGVTGTVGKSSTATMLAGIFEAAGQRTWLGGNLGGSLLDVVDRMRPDDYVVLELSSFQLHWLSPQVRMPSAAVLTGFSPHHLDWHGSAEHYRTAKERLFREQCGGDVAIFGNDADWSSIAAGRVISPLADDRLPALAVAGTHQRRNAALAASMAIALGCSIDAVDRGLRAFRPLPHRLECIAEIERRRFYDDSKSTSPPATLAALETCGPQTWLLAGGALPTANLEPLIHATIPRTLGAAFFGAAATTMHTLAQQCDPSFRCAALTDLRSALEWSWALSARGDNILLSPACASFDAYRDYAARGEHFAELLCALAGSSTIAPSRSILLSEINR